MDDLELCFDPLPSEALMRFVENQIIAVGYARTGSCDSHPVNFFLKSPLGEVMGGLIGYIWGGWLHINLLWVSEVLRGQGHGTRLIDAAEAMARERGAAAATLETFSFQAPGFYRKRGYVVFGQIDDYPPGHTKFFLRKNLA